MIEITYRPRAFSFEMRGHAGYGRYGEDIVCASASALFYTLTYNISGKPERFETPPEIKAESGKAGVICVPKKEYRQETGLIFETVVNGFKLLAENFPQNITLKIIHGS